MSATTFGISDFGFGGALPKHDPAVSKRGNTFMAALIDSAERKSREDARHEELAAQAARQIARAAARAAVQTEVGEPEEAPAEIPADLPVTVRQLRRPPQIRSNPLLRAVSWLNRRCSISSTKELRVAETVSLGEKRFVAVVHVANQKFLIGGGSQSVSLLTRLDEPSESAAGAPASGEAE